MTKYNKTLSACLLAAMLPAAAQTEYTPEKLYVYSGNSIVFATNAEQLDSVAWDDNGARVTLFDKSHEPMFASSTSLIDSMSNICSVPKAALLDVVFNPDGTATDISRMANEIQTISSDKLHTYYNPTYGRYAAHFDNPWAGAASGYYKIDYSTNEAFKNALAAGHTLECVVMANEVNNSEAKFFSSHQAGGTGLMICNKNDGRKYNSFVFLPNISQSGSSTWRWANSNVHPVPQQYYHLVAVYNKDEATASIYVDGELKSTTAAPGTMLHAASGSQWFGIGCDPGGSKGEQAWHGDVVLARIYDTPLTAYDAQALYEQLQNADTPSQSELPTAKVLDLVFNADGTASDISEMANKVTTVPSDRLYTYYSPAFGGYVAHFDNDYAGLATGYYRVDYADNAPMKAALEGGHTLECVVMTDIDIPDTEAKFFSSHGAGGTGLMICNKQGGRANNALTFLPYTGTDYRWANSNIRPQSQVFYHVVGTYDKENRLVNIYINGVLQGSGSASGDYKHPSDTNLHWFGIGCDPGTRDGRVVGEQAWHGDVALARIYDKPLSAEEVASLWAAVKPSTEYKEPELVTDIRLYSMPVVAGKSFTIFGNGFKDSDKVEMIATGMKQIDIACSLNERGISVALPTDIASGQYRFVLHRNGQQQTLGNATLTVVDKMPASAEVIAHRGHWNVEGASQNSRASLQNAINLDVYGSETDVWITTDNHLMINHDRTFGGVTLCESIYDQCKNLTLGNGEKMPELHELLDMVKAATDRQTRLVIEVKDHGTQSLDTRAADATVQAVAAAGMTGSEKIKYISFSRDACEKIIALEPDAEVAFICSNASNALTPAQLHDLGYHGFDYEITLLRNNLSWIAQAHDLGMIVNVWTVDNPTDMIDLTNKGVDLITTNNPEAALDIKWHYDHSAD